MANILFIYSLKNWFDPKKPLISPEDAQSGISYISSYLHQHHHTTDLFIITEKTKFFRLRECIKSFNPSVICYTAVTTEYDCIAETASTIKNKWPEIYQVIGGPHASLNPEKVIADAFDCVCVGEGEYPIVELVQQLEEKYTPSNIKNLWIKRKGSVEKNPPREFIEDLDLFPFPDRKMWQKWIRDPHARHKVVLGRGCPFHCTYCCNHSFKALAKGTYVRLRGIQSIIQEIREIRNTFPKTKEIYLEIETLGISNKFDQLLFDQIILLNKEFSTYVSYGANLRIAKKKNYAAFFSSLKKAHFNFINIGLESGNRRVREEILKRDYSNEEFITAVRNAKRAGLKVNLSLMVGIPGESLSDFKDTVEMIRKLQPDQANLSIYYPYPGTNLYDYCKDNEFLPDEISTDYERRCAVIDLPGFSKKQIQKQYDWFYYEVYKGHKSTYRLLKEVFLYRKMMVSPLGRIIITILSSIKKF